MENSIINSLPPTHYRINMFSNICIGLDRPCEFQEVEACRYQYNQHTSVVRLSALGTGHIYPPRKYSWYSFLLEAEMTPGSS